MLMAIDYEIYRTYEAERQKIIKMARLEMRELGIEEKDVDWSDWK